MVGRAALVLAGLALSPSVAAACAVCYGRAEGNVIQGAQMSVLFMLVLIYLLLGGGIAAMVLLRRRQRRVLAASASQQGPLPGPSTYSADELV